MPRIYKRKTGRGNTPLDVMIRAADLVLSGHLIRAAAKEYSIDRSTLRRYVKKREAGNNAENSENIQHGYKSLGALHAVFQSQNGNGTSRTRKGAFQAFSRCYPREMPRSSVRIRREECD